MRIMAGSNRGHRFKSVPKNLPVKPISARIKKSVFDILRPRLGGARFLDLYAGTGSVGLEALSRGAETVFFVDYDQRCLAVIDQNLAALGLRDRAATGQGNILEDLSWVSYRSKISKFDLIYLGPPYRDPENRPLAYSSRSLARVVAAGLPSPDAWILVQHHVKEATAAPPGWARFRREKYGDTEVDFFRAESGSATDAAAA